MTGAPVLTMLVGHLIHVAVSQVFMVMAQLVVLDVVRIAITKVLSMAPRPLA